MQSLQLWVVLPESARNMPPRVQLVRRDSAPVRRLPGVELRLYSGRSGDVVSPTRNTTPVTLADIRLEPGGVLEQDLPLADNGFLLVLNGEVVVGESGVRVSKGQIGWLDRPVGAGDSVLTIRCEGEAARALLYTGTPQNFSPIAQGPFIAGSEAEIFQLFAAYRQGAFPRAATLPIEAPV
jgi:redox-sensitive bicupin YhaK (pirin superfamily)